MDRLRLPRLKAQLLYLVIVVLLFKTTSAESNQSTAQTVTESVIPISSTHLSAGTSKDLDLSSANQQFQNLTVTRKTTQMLFTATSHELSPLYASTTFSTLPSVDKSTKTLHLYDPSSPRLTSVDTQSSSNMIDNIYTETDRTAGVKTSPENRSNTKTVTSAVINPSPTSDSVSEFLDRSTSFGIRSTVTRTESFASYTVRQESEMVKTTLHFSLKTEPPNTNTESSANTRNLIISSYRPLSQTAKASEIREISEFASERVLHPSIISLLASSPTTTTSVPTEGSSSSTSSSTSFSNSATTTIPYDLYVDNTSVTSNNYRSQLNPMLAGGHDSHGDMGASSISPTEVTTEAKTNPHLHSSLVQIMGNGLPLDASAVITTSQVETRSSSSNQTQSREPSSSVVIDNRSPELYTHVSSIQDLFSPATTLKPSPTVSVVNIYTATTTVNLHPIEEKNDEQQLMNGISNPSTQTQSRQSNEIMTQSSTSRTGSIDSSSRSSTSLGSSHPHKNRTLSTTPKNKVLSTTGVPLTSSLADHGRTNAEFALATFAITSQSSLTSADERATDETFSSVEQVDKFPHPTHEKTISQPCTNITTWETTSVASEGNSNDSPPKPLKYDFRFAITLQGDCEVMTDDAKLQLEFWESIISVICDILHLPEHTLHPEDINCPPLTVYFTLKQISRIDAFEVLNYTISNNSFEVPIIADSVLVTYRGKSIQRLEPSNGRPDGSVTTLERLDILIISIAGVLFFVLLVACSCICCREMYKRKHVQSFDLKETPHVSVKVEDYTLTRIPRTKVIYTDSHMLTEEDLGVNHQQIESGSKENGDHRLNESFSKINVDQCQNQSESTVNGEHGQHESGSKVNSDHHIDESKLKVIGDYHHQNESESKVSGDPVEGREKEIDQDSIRIKVRSLVDGIVVGVTCSPSQIPKVTNQLSDCLVPTGKNLSGESNESLIEKSEGEEGLSNPNCRVDDERYAGHTSPEEDEELL